MPQSNQETRSQINQATPSKIRFADEAGPSAASSGPVTPSTPGKNTTNVTNSTSVDLYTDAFNFALSKNCSSTLMDSLSSKDDILKEIRDCINTGNDDRCRQISPYFQSYWKDLHVKNGCVCVEYQLAIPNSIKDVYVEAIHAKHPGSWGMTDMVVHAWWPLMQRDLLSKTTKCNPCVKIGKNLKSIIPSSRKEALKLCKILNEEIQIDFGRPIYKRKIKRFIYMHV